jgi:hypothetical protein
MINSFSIHFYKISPLNNKRPIMSAIQTYGIFLLITIGQLFKITVINNLSFCSLINISNFQADLFY